MREMHGPFESRDVAEVGKARVGFVVFDECGQRIAEPVQVAAMVVEQFPYEAEQIAIDFLEGATRTSNQSSVLFWTIVLDSIEKMQQRMSGDANYRPELRLTDVM